MRKGIKIALGATVGLVGIASSTLIASGFPERIGLTKTETKLSLPGDLVLPAAGLQADRAHTFKAHASDVWPQLLLLEELYSDLWERELEIVYSEADEAIVWKTSGDPIPGIPGNGWSATLSASVLPAVDNSVTLHVRERFQISDDGSLLECRILRFSSGILTPGIWRKVAVASSQQIS